MSTSFDSIYQKLASSLEQNGAKQSSETRFDPLRQISPAAAHELNNIIAIIMGYSERLLLKHGADPALEPHLKLIIEATRRAAKLVQESTPTRGGRPLAGAGVTTAPPVAPAVAS